MHYFVGLNGKQAATVSHPVCVDCCLFKYCAQLFKIFSARFDVYLFRYVYTFVGYEKALENLPCASWKVLDFFVSKKRVGTMHIVSVVQFSSTSVVCKISS